MAYPRDLPPVGLESTMRASAVNAALKIGDLGTVTLDLTGWCEVRVEADLGAGWAA
ncbi:SH3 domain-containing protein OS=Kitasatospora aureofaciens OX=1894 GN=GCM10010502_02880 PE=4 SV=1 [Kitasatospora aureofaciens]|uniref:Uncharacterized protein n=1 Tax=Kitasatospora aureofaciens TaxID=1894 RepID=A0A8H9HG38_KITAU|nr:hypothetical protein GCM10010502_02880 [Kitasatospora aureofaciens]